MNKQTVRLIVLRGLLALIALMAVLPALPAQAAPADPFAGASPTFSPAPKESVNYNVGDWGVSDQRGSATYTYDLPLPPGRNGMAPTLALRYASTSPLRGGIAAGWTLTLPSIEQDHSLGVDAGVRYRAVLGNASGRLEVVDDDLPFGDADATYRINFDDGYTRFFRRKQGDNYSWSALSSDGITHHFSQYAINGTNPRWRIERQEDFFGNTVIYNWSPVQSRNGTEIIDYKLNRIEYTFNAAAGLDAFAKVEFEYAPLEVCAGSPVPIGAAVRTASREVDGALRLTAIRTFVRDTVSADWRLSRHFTLSYRLQNSKLYEDGQIIAPGETTSPVASSAFETLCSQNPLRYLTQIDVAAYAMDGTVSTLPPVTFEYNSRIVTTGPYDGLPNAHPMRKREVAVAGYAQHGNSGRKLAGIQGDSLDLDGDGIRDRLGVVREGDLCKLIWHKGLLGGNFEPDEHTSMLPTAPWYADWKGRPHSDPNITAAEGCTLNGQIAYRDYSESKFNGKGVVSYHFVDYNNDGRLDLLTNVWATVCHWTYDPFPINQSGNCAFGMSGAQVAAASPSAGIEPFPGETDFVPMTPDEEAKRFIWQVYANTGDADNLFQVSKFLPPIRVKSPLPLAPSASDERLDHSIVVQVSIPPLVDLDGDGFLDIVDTRSTLLTDCDNELLGSCDWTVYFGDGDGNFPILQDAYVWEVPTFGIGVGLGQARDSESCILEYDHIHTIYASLRDISGDGLLDLVVQTSNFELNVYVNRGGRFSNVALPLNTARPVERIQTDCEVASGNMLIDGQRGYLRRLVDLDSDGLLDMLIVNEGEEVGNISDEHNIYARFNVGNRFGPLYRLPNAWGFAKRLMVADLVPEGSANPFAGEWHVELDFTDVTGDGLADLAKWDGTKITYINRPGLSNAPDLLAAVNNGRGMRVEFRYAPSTDAAVVQWTGAEPALLPYVTWVVRETTVKGGFGMPPMTTTYRYQDPRFLSPKAYSGVPEGAHFAGFTQSIASTTVVEGVARETRRLYAYQALEADGDLVAAPNGLLMQENTYLNGELHEHTEKQWLYMPLFQGKVQVTLPAGTLSCIANGTGQTPETCMAQEGNVHRLQQTWIPAPTGGEVPCRGGDSSQPATIAKLYLNTLTQEGSGISQGALDRRTVRCYEVRYGQAGFAAHDYRILLADSLQEDIQIEGDIASFETRSHTRIHYDSATGLPVQSDHWMNEATVATTLRTYDAATGNLLTQIKPEQGVPAGSGKKMEFAYDAHALFVQSTTNELGHQLFTTYDMATGAPLERRGPNFITLPSNQVIWERELWRLDGFGRPLEHDLSFDDGEQYALHTVDKMSYFDYEQPNRMRAEHLRDVGGDHWVTSENLYDGLGRVLTETLFLEGSQAALTTYAYDANGNLTAIETPDPRSDDGARVRYRYAHDGLGRVVQFIRPDNGGITISYYGLTKTIQELTSDASGAKKMEVYDALGRLVELHEFDPTAPTAVSRYHYDGQNNLTQIIDAEGNTMLLGHDWMGNRIAVTRGERTWRYVYDRNGNIVSRQAPMGASVEDAATQATTYVYDDLDRLVQITFQDLAIERLDEPEVITKDSSVFLPAVMRETNMEGVAAAAAPHFVDAEITTSAIHYTYDQGRNGVGRVGQVDLPFGKILYGYEARGLIATEERLFALNGIATASATQRVERQYNALGQPTLSVWDDGQQWQITYDSRGLVDTVQWFDPQANTWQAVADYDRSLLGLPRTRNSVYGQVRQFDYDILGRTTAESVTVNGNPFATRGYSFNGAGNITHVTGAISGVSAEAIYTYDAQHRLKSASGPNGYLGAFTYSANGNVASASITWNGTSEARQVRYAYGERDPQAVDQLIDQASGTAYAQFDYDLSGNLVKRTTPEGESSLLWDGRDQLRVVSGPNGVEVYFYDDAGMRTLAVSESEGVRFWFGESETHYSLEGAQTLRYLHLAAGTALARVENKNKIELQYTDALQNLMFALDSAGNTVASFLYGAFGEVVQATGDADHRRQFNGKENDVVSGLRYYGYRYYDPLTLRWASADPLYRVLPDLGLGAPQRMNLYAFSLNNSMRYYDPDGRDTAPQEDMPFGWPSTPVEGSPGGGPYCTGGGLFTTTYCNNDDSQESTADDTQEPSCDSSSQSCVADEEASQEAKEQLEQSLSGLEETLAIVEMKEQEIKSIKQQLVEGKPPVEKTIDSIFTLAGVVTAAFACGATAGIGCYLVAGVTMAWSLRGLENDHGSDNPNVPFTYPEGKKLEGKIDTLQQEIDDVLDSRFSTMEELRTGN